SPLIDDYRGKIEDVGAKAKREAEWALEDYGYYAVPALIDLVQSTDGDKQSVVCYWLGRSAHRIVQKKSGQALTDADLTRIRAINVENAMLSTYQWERDAAPERRAEVVAQWTSWFEKNKSRWDHSGWEKFKRSLTDTQFGVYWGRLLKGDLGESYTLKKPVLSLIGERLKYSLCLNVVAFLIAYMVAVPLGILTAVKQGTLIDRVIAIGLFMLYSLPNYFVATLLVRYLSVDAKIFPIEGFESENAAELNTWQHFKDVLWHITLPILCLSYGGLAFLSRFSRSGMLDVIRSDYIRTARAKGLSEWNVIFKHVVRNGILPVVTLLGTSLPVLISGSVAIEYIFDINGMGLLMIKSIFAKDYNVVMGVQLIVGILTMIGILLSDIAYAVLDPRISLS
ncbi:MAG: ABC transporter permease, partial [Planctomycetota bacterium]|nr:ABC transporter permease [Planctomycetota bacterium]